MQVNASLVLPPCNESPSIIRWNLEEPRGPIEILEGGPSKIKVNGWILSREPDIKITIRAANRETTYDFTVDRPDAIEAILEEQALGHPKLKCGFNFDIEITDKITKSFEIGITGANATTWIGTVLLSPTFKVIRGGNSWLFLDNDTNFSVDQYKGVRPLSQPTLDGWSEHFTEVSNLSKSLGFRWLFTMAPAKEYIFPEYYPFPYSKDNTPLTFLAHFADTPEVTWPADAIISEREFCYWKGDTHWTDYGALVAAEDIARNLNLQGKSLRSGLKFKIEYQIGDLGEKAQPAVLNPCIVLDGEVEFVSKVFDNAIWNGGRVRIFEQRDAATVLTCIIFGGSSSTALCPFITRYFKRVVFIHSTAAIDTEVLSQEKPDYVILQTNSRFINVTPQNAENYSLRKTVKHKISQLSHSEKEQIRINLSNQKKDGNEFYLDLMREALNYGESTNGRQQ